VLDFDQDEKGELFLVMEYVDGVSLSEPRADRGRLPFPVAAYVAVEALSGLRARPTRCQLQDACAAWVHRDVTPHNVLLSGEGNG